MACSFSHRKEDGKHTVNSVVEASATRMTETDIGNNIQMCLGEIKHITPILLLIPVPILLI